MKGEDRQQLENRLMEERERALQSLHQASAEESTPQSEAAGDVTKFPTHMADESFETEEQERDFMIAAEASDRVQQIDRALELLRSDPERYARCDRCGREIEMERFDLIPWTRLCARCAREVEG